ncbi:hypothetical protein CRG98_003068 [Punica granatum]|uniref:Uncharacterized protein n=1 Tax=Punica granatum TaxID=22663 RepID=A0A2I0L735_PUNGR|nr:hypothetical protein CRG98_003068 [Punica granatum]
MAELWGAFFDSRHTWDLRHRRTGLEVDSETETYRIDRFIWVQSKTVRFNGVTNLKVQLRFFGEPDRTRCRSRSNQSDRPVRSGSDK